MRTATFTAFISIACILSACDAEAPEEAPPQCALAAQHLEECTGTVSPVFGASCNPAEAELLLETPCEVLAKASGMTYDMKADGAWEDDLPFTCRWLNLGCPPDESCLLPLSEDAREEVIWLSEPTSLSGPADAQFRVNEIARIFREEGDPRGLFATVYRLITNRAVESVSAGDYEHPVWAHDLITEFARRYLANLHGHLTDGPVTGQWKKYYALSRDCRVGRGRTLGVAIAVHLMVDLPYVLYGIGSLPEQRDDFVVFGDILLEIFPQLIIDVEADYETDVSRLLNGFFLGDWVDHLTSEGTMTAFMYQGVRLKAWRDGQNLRHFPEPLVTAEIRLAWGLAELALAKLDANGAL